MNDEWQNEYGEVDNQSEGSTLWRVIYILIVFMIIMGLLSPAVRQLFQGIQAEAENSPNRLAAPEEDTAVLPQTDDLEAGGETAVLPQSSTTEPEASEPDLSINRIALITNDGQVATINPNGTERLILTPGDKQYQFPAWSPDGQYVASIGTSSGRGSISLIEDNIELAPREVYASVTEQPFYLYWSPDSQAISFLAQNDDTPMALHLVNVDGTVEDGSQKIATGGPFYWDWFLDSQQLFIHSGVTGPDARLTFIAPDGEATTDNLAQPGAFQVPVISADGRYIAYAAITGAGASEVVIQDLQNGATVTHRHNGLAAMSWSPGANLLAYTSTSDPDQVTFVGPLRVLDPFTGETKILTDAPVLAYFWSPDGNYLAYYTLVNRQSDDFNAFDEQRILGKGGMAKQALQFDLPEFEVTIVDVRTGEGRIAATGFVPSLTFITQFLPFFDQYALSHSLWSPASDAFLISYMEEGIPKIGIVSVSGGQMREITDGRIAFWSRQ